MEKTEWVLIDTFGSKTLYVIPASKTKSGNLINLWGITDRKIASENGILSTQWYFKFDCKKGEYDLLDVTSYSEHMGRGGVVDHVSSKGSLWWLSEVKQNSTTDIF